MRRGFLLNASVLILIIPLMLLMATYENVSNQVITAQSERTHVERTYDVVSFLNLEFQKALELSGKRAVVATVDYVSVTGRFISPSYMANNTIRDLMLSGTSSSITGYDIERVMGKQTLRVWLSNVTKMLAEQGYEVSPSLNEIVDSMEIRVAPLDAFTVVVKGRIPHIRISDRLGKIVYSGPIPSTGGYVYSTVDIRDLEDPIFSAMTGGRYQRSIRACPLAYPEFGEGPVVYANGSGSSSVGHVVGNFEEFPQLSSDLGYNLTHVWDQNGDYLTNFTIDGAQVTTDAFIKASGDVGVMVFSNVSSGSGGGGGTVPGWCSPLGYRINLTVQNQVGVDLNDYQIPLLISTAKGFTSQILNVIFQNTQNTYSLTNDPYQTNASIAFYDSNCNPIPFWIEYWDPVNKRALIWIRASIPKGSSLNVEMYFGGEVTPTKGDGKSVFVLFAGPKTINGGNSREYLINQKPLDLYGGFAVRFRMKGNGNYRDWDSGVIVEDSDLIPDDLAFTDDTTRSGDGLAIHWAWWIEESHVSARYPITSFHVYEALMKPYSTYWKSAKFKDITDGRVNYDSGYSPRYWVEPLEYVYWATDSERKRRTTTYDWVAVRKYTISSDLLEDPNFNGITFYWRTTDPAQVIEQKPSSGSSGQSQASGGRVYDLQLLINCLMDQRYIATKNGWSFFERLEGSNRNHLAYEKLANDTQDEMGYTYGGRHYPIGLVSFMIPDPNYDSKLYNLFATLGLTVEDGESSVDYYFLNYYFNGGQKVTGYRVWGISEGVLATGDLSTVPFFLDPGTAGEVIGPEGTCDLLYGYTCP